MMHLNRPSFLGIPHWKFGSLPQHAGIVAPNQSRAPYSEQVVRRSDLSKVKVGPDNRVVVLEFGYTVLPIPQRGTPVSEDRDGRPDAPRPPPQRMCLLYVVAKILENTP